MLATLLVQYNPDGSLVYQNPYLNTQLIMGRQPFQYVEIDLDYCANTAGVAPCAASQTGDAKCFNTYATCNDTPNFNLTTRTYRDWETDRKSTRLNSSHRSLSRMPSSA